MYYMYNKVCVCVFVCVCVVCVYKVYGYILGVIEKNHASRFSLQRFWSILSLVLTRCAMMLSLL